MRYYLLSSAITMTFLNCKQNHLHVLRTKRHNKGIWALKKLIVSFKHSKCYIFMNVGTFNDNPLENIILPSLLPCMCGLQKCHCNAGFKPEIICVKRLSYQANPLKNSDNNLSLTYILYYIKRSFELVYSIPYSILEVFNLFYELKII